MNNLILPRKTSRRNLAKWKALQSGLDRMIRNFELEDNYIRPLLEAHVNHLENEQHEGLFIDAIEGADEFAILQMLPELPSVLIAARKTLGWTQVQLAQKADLKKQNINRYERGGYLKITLDTILVLAQILELGLQQQRERRSQTQSSPADPPSSQRQSPYAERLRSEGSKGQIVIRSD